MRTLTAKEAHAVFGGAIGDLRPGVFETGDIFVLETVTIYGDPSGGAESLRDFGTFLTIATGGAGIFGRTVCGAASRFRGPWLHGSGGQRRRAVQFNRRYRSAGYVARHMGKYRPPCAVRGPVEVK